MKGKGIFCQTTAATNEEYRKELKRSPTVDISKYSTFFSFLAIFHVLKCVLLIFRDFQFSCHIPRPTVDISKFSTFFSFPRHISSPKLCISHFL